MPTDFETHVVVVSDHPLFRDALVSAIDADPRFDASGTTSHELPDADLFVIDFDLDVPDPMGVVDELSDAEHGTVVLLSSATQDRAYDLIEVGARGLMHKSCSAEEILGAVHRVAEGDSVIPTPLQSTISEAIRSHPTPIGSLSNRELEILEFSAEGLSATAIGQRLSLSESTIKSQLTRIYESSTFPTALRRSLWRCVAVSSTDPHP